MQRQIALCAILILVATVGAGCVLPAPAPTPVPPTKTPKPTFTFTPIWTPTPEPFPTPTPEPFTATPEATATPVPTLPPPTDTPNPTPRLTANQTANVRQGPGTNYAIIGRLTAGQSFDITGKNPAGDWLQFDFNGRPGWVYGELVTVSGDQARIQVAQNIPPPPPRPTATRTPVPQPTATPRPRYEFNIALVQRCDRQPAGNWFGGTVYKGGKPVNGYRVVFSYAPDGPWVTQPQISGPHEGYWDWAPGYYSHIINASQPKAGDWYVWIVDANGNRISEIAHWHSTGPGEGCNMAVVDFDSR